MTRAIVLWLALAGVAAGQDSGLADLRARLAGLRERRAALVEKPESAGVELTAIKHLLRDWVEGQLGSIEGQSDIPAVQARMELTVNGLNENGADDDQNYLGTVGGIDLSLESGMLTVWIGVGILCQMDDSAYLYERRGEAWTRIWESEQLDYSGKYLPQHLTSVQVWREYQEGRSVGPVFVMTLGNEWGCASTWHTVYYRLWRVGGASSKLLIDGSDMAWLQASGFVTGKISGNGSGDHNVVDVLLEFTQADIDIGVHHREAIRHFQIHGDRVKRVAPVALSPRDFVDEWLTSAWELSAEWSESPGLQREHDRSGPKGGWNMFQGPSLHCEKPDLWQVNLAAFGDGMPDAGVPRYFLVRWRPSYRFTMVAVRNTPWPACRKPDPGADEPQALFPEREP